jgi:hypothetical protein
MNKESSAPTFLFACGRRNGWRRSTGIDKQRHRVDVPEDFATKGALSR